MGLTAHCESPMLIFDTLEANGEKHTIKVKRCFSGFSRGLFTKSPLGRGMGRSPKYMGLTAHCESPMLIFDTLGANGENHTIKVKRCFSGFPRGLFTKSPLGRGMGRSPIYMGLTAHCESPMLIFDTLGANGEKHTIKVKRCFSGFPRGLFTKSPLWRGMGRSPIHSYGLTARVARYVGAYSLISEQPGRSWSSYRSESINPARSCPPICSSSE